MEKVRLPKEVVTALNRILDGNSAQSVFNDFMGDMRGTAWTWESTTIYEYFKDDMYELAQAFIHGYEVEQSPEDKAIEWLMNQDIINRESATNLVKGIKAILEGGEA